MTLVRDARRRIVAAYAGDANGNLWRFDLRGDPSVWKVSYGKPLFTTVNNRPIYGAPAWQAHPEGGNIVVIATGMLLEDSDLADTTQRGSIYGIWDPTSGTGQEKAAFETASPSALLEQRVVQLEAKLGTESYYSISREIIDWTKHRGWTLTLGHTHLGERSIDQIRNLSSSVIINTTVLNSGASTDSESCTPGNLPANYLYALNALDGAGKPAFDLNRDGTPEAPALAFTELGGYSRGIAFFSAEKTTNTSVETTNFDGIQNEAGESTTSHKDCKPIQKDITGLSNSSFEVVVTCDPPPPGTPKPWSRQQYQLTRPPL